MCSRPYISLNGARIGHEIAHASKIMLRDIPIIVELVSWKCSPICGRPGAIIELVSGGKNV
jgi:hypothetical protein